MPVRDDSELAADACGMLFRFLARKTNQSLADKLAKEVLEGSDDWELRLSRLCEVVKRGIDTQWR